MSIRVIILFAVTIIGIVMMSYVLLNVGKLKTTRFLKSVIALVTIFIAPIGFLWYLLQRRKDKKKKRK